MLGDGPFVLFDDARASGAADARFFSDPRDLFVAREPADVVPVLKAAQAARATTGGTLAGYVSYEAGYAFEPHLAHLAPPRTGAAGPLVWLGLFGRPETIRAADMAAWLAEQIVDPDQAVSNQPASIGPLEPQIAPGDYLARFDRLAEAIRAGEIYQANLTLPLAGAARGNPVAIYAAIRPEAAAGYGGLLFDGAHWLLSFSPELFFSLEGREAKCRPMKGTRPRGRNEAGDRALAAELAASVKDKAENLMIVDLMRNDLSRVTEPGSVRVEDAFALETYPTLHTMTSTVRARLADGCDALDVLRALFPCGSITGAPKIRAMELLAGLENHARGPYCGTIGWIGPAVDPAANTGAVDTGASGEEASGDGAGHDDAGAGNGDSGQTIDAAFNVAIRTIRLTPGENGRHKAVLGVGGAIVADSTGMAEWRECLVKGGFVRGRAGGHDLIETMRLENGAIALRGLHMDRLERSAAELGFACDRSQIERAIERVSEQAASLGKPATPAQKLRVLLARSGAVAIETELLGDHLDPLPAIALPHPTVPGDWRLRHKSSDRGFYDHALKEAHRRCASEVVLVRDDGLVTEGCWTSVFVERDGALLTPPLSLGLLPSVLRRSLLDAGRAREAQLALADLADGFLLGNAVRGLIPARLME